MMTHLNQLSELKSISVILLAFGLCIQLPVASPSPALDISSPANNAISVNRTINVTGSSAGSSSYLNHSTVAQFNGTNSDTEVVDVSGGEIVLGLGLYDDFNDNSLDGARWTAAGSGGISYSETGSEMKLSGSASSQYWTANQRVSSYSACGNVAQADIRISSFSGSGHGAWIEFYQDSNNRIYFGYTYDTSTSTTPANFAWGKMSSGSGSWGAYKSAPSGFNTIKLVYDTVNKKVGMYTNGTCLGNQSITLSNFKLVLYASTRASGDSVDARFDNVRMYYNNNGNYSSLSQDTQMAVPEFHNVTWKQALPSGTNLSLYFRFSASADMNGATGWYCATQNQTDFSSWTVGRYLQYRVELNSTVNTSTPELQSLSVRLFKNITRVEASLDNSTWTNATGTVNWTVQLNLSEDDNTVYIRATDATGENITRSITLKLDTTAPTGELSINNNATYTCNQSVTLSITGTDRYGLSRMMISDNESFAGASWELSNSLKAWTIPPGDGLKTVHVKLMDTNGWVSDAFCDTIILHTSPPNGSVLINAGAAITSSRDVVLSFNATDEISVIQFKVSNYADLGGLNWEEYCATRNWTLQQADGQKNVFVKYRNIAGGESAVFNDSIILDTVNPTGNVIINQGEDYTNISLVTLTINASDANGVAEMLIGNEGPLDGAWEPYRTARAWPLSPEDGTKTVCVRLRDRAGLESANFTDSIILDTHPPAGTIRINDGAAITLDQNVTLGLSATDMTSVSGMQISDTPGFEGAQWTPFAPTTTWKLLPGQGVRTVYVRFLDVVGQYCEPTSDSIILAGQNASAPQPEATVKINNGENLTGQHIVKLTTNIINGTVLQTRISNQPDFSGSLWESVMSERNWTLSPGDGLKTVYVSFISDRGVEFRVDATITLDTIAPVCSVVINDNDSLCGGNFVTLRINASDATGVEAILVSNDRSFSGASWIPLESLLPWTLETGNGLKAVYVKARDRVGHESETASDIIQLDTSLIVPRGKILINGDRMYATSPRVMLTLALDDSAIASSTRMMLSNDAGLSGASWEIFTNSREWDLLPQDGLKNVYVIFEYNGIKSQIAYDAITLDTTPPSPPRTEPIKSPTYNSTATVRGKVSPGENLTINGVTVTVGPDGAFYTIVALRDGSNAIRLLVSDPAGNTCNSTVNVVRKQKGKDATTTVENLFPLIVIAIGAAAGATLGVVLMSRRARQRRQSFARTDRTAKGGPHPRAQSHIDQSAREPPAPYRGPAIIPPGTVQDTPAITPVDQPIKERISIQDRISVDDLDDEPESPGSSDAAGTAATALAEPVISMGSDIQGDTDPGQILKTLSSLPRGLPSSLGGMEMDELASAIASAEHRTTQDGERLVRLRGKWYYGDNKDIGTYLQRYKGT